MRGKILMSMPKEHTQSTLQIQNALILLPQSPESWLQVWTTTSWLGLCLEIGSHSLPWPDWPGILCVLFIAITTVNHPKGLDFRPSPRPTFLTWNPATILNLRNPPLFYSQPMAFTEPHPRLSAEASHFLNCFSEILNHWVTLVYRQ